MWPKHSYLKTVQTRGAALAACAVLAASCFGQASGKPATPAASAQHAIELVAKGRCREALPVLKKANPLIKDKQLLYRSEMATARCAMSLNQEETAVSAILLLKREFPKDPEVLYVATHYYSTLANNAAQEIAAVAPTSYQARELEAEGLESQGKWDEAIAQYKKILEQNPKVQNIHYRLGQALLSVSNSAGNAENAKREFEEELKVDPNSASAEFMLGELARRGGEWPEAIEHFSRASALDEGFLEADLALGMSLNSASKFAEAVAPLQKYVELAPGDPAGHYQLAIAYARTGRKELANHEMELQKDAAKQTSSTEDASKPQ